MESSAARSLMLVCFLLAISGCHSMQQSSVESLRRTLRALPERRSADALSMSVPEGSRKGGNDSTEVGAATRVQNVTVPHFLRELLEEPVNNLDNVNSIRSYVNQAIDETQCGWMKFGLPWYNPDTQYVKSELKIFHRVPADQLAEMNATQKRHKFNIYLCYQFKHFCIPFTHNITVTAATDHLLTFEFIPKQLLRRMQRRKLTTLKVRIRVANSKRLIPCKHWLLNFVTDDSLGEDRVPLMVTYMKQPEKSVLTMFLNEAVKNAPIPASSEVPRQKRDVNPCERKSLVIQAGWHLTQELTFSNTHDIGFCEGHCSELHSSKDNERAALLDMARRRGHVSLDDYPESCVPHETTSVRMVIIPEEEQAYIVIKLHNLEVKSCTCVL